MFESIGGILATGPAAAAPMGRRSLHRDRTLEPVRRHSYTAGRCEARIWRPTSRQEISRIVLAARRYELTGRQQGRRGGPLGHVAIEVLELFANLIRYQTGRLEPSLDFIMAKLKRSRDAIVRALRALRDHGFLDWLRRYVPTGNDSGPQVQQTSNAYRLSLPPRAARLLGRYGQTPPAPDDHSHAAELRAAELDAHLASLSLVERTLFTVTDDDLAARLASFAASIEQRKERESARRSESPSQILTKGR